MAFRNRLLSILPALALAGCVHSATPIGWTIEAESPQARVQYLPGGVVDIDTPRGLSLWYPDRLDGPVRIAFDAMAVSAGGPNDQVSDLNAFWMATDPAAPHGSVLGNRRTGRFEDYDTLTTYYVGIGGNRNTTTRMRRYTGRPGDRPLLPQHDRADVAALLQPNRWTRIVLIADGAEIAVERDGRRLFTMRDPQPYRSGWFALRTTQSHLRIRRLRITRR
ncbi:Tat pathway signal sequence domain protein [Nostoc sp. 3335mG]|nr:Tat pathway signal sequence domain protein [Nostoc sp. 3335mG]